MNLLDREVGHSKERTRRTASTSRENAADGVDHAENIFNIFYEVIWNLTLSPEDIIIILFFT
jgi:hypothetical protein